MGPKPVILDVDPGHDDAVALMMACGSPGLDLLAVTTVAGNATLPKTTRNALRVLSLIGRTDVPVAAGASKPLESELRTAENIHGESGMDGPEIPEATFEAGERGAVRLIADTLMEAPGPVALIPLGPLTNIGLSRTLGDGVRLLPPGPPKPFSGRQGSRPQEVEVRPPVALTLYEL